MSYPEFDLYGELGVSPGATEEEIKQAYRRLAREWHPDTNPDPTAEERFKCISVAYDIVGDADERPLYDVWLHHGDLEAQLRAAMTGSRESLPPPRFVLTLIKFIEEHKVLTIMICISVLLLIGGVVLGIYLLTQIIPDWAELAAAIVVYLRWKTR